MKLNVFTKESAKWQLSFCLCAVFGFTALSYVEDIKSNLYSPTLSKEQKLRPPLKDLKLVTFGFHELGADLLWLRFIQNLDYCREIKIGCQMGWGYQMVSVIHDLAPKFRIPMAVGPMSLSVLNDDYKGADELFRKAIKAFPNDWPILYRAGYHFLEEGNDPVLASELFERAEENGGPNWLSSLAARSAEKAGRAEIAMRILEDYKKSLEDPVAIKKVDERIARLRSR